MHWIQHWYIWSVTPLCGSKSNAVAAECGDCMSSRPCRQHWTCLFWTQNHETKYVDLGGAYIGPTQNRILRVAKEFGVETHKVNEKENLVHYIKVRRFALRLSRMEFIDFRVICIFAPVLENFICHLQYCALSPLSMKWKRLYLSLVWTGCWTFACRDSPYK